jgi:hypothetical protein
MAFKKGDPNINRKGRIRGSVSIVEAIKRQLLKVPPGQKRTHLDLIVAALFEKAIKDKDVQAIRDLINRTDGMPKQPITGGGEGDQPISILANVISKYDSNKKNNSTDEED